jgi:hypothetical protein
MTIRAENITAWKSKLVSYPLHFAKGEVARLAASAFVSANPSPPHRDRSRQRRCRTVGALSLAGSRALAGGAAFAAVSGEWGGDQRPQRPGGKTAGRGGAEGVFRSTPAQETDRLRSLAEVFFPALPELML